MLPLPWKCRSWDAGYEAVNLADIPHRRLTKPVKVFEQWFDGGERKGRGRCVAPEGALLVRREGGAASWSARCCTAFCSGSCLPAALHSPSQPGACIRGWPHLSS